MCYQSFSTSKTERCSFKSGCVILVENDEMHRQLQPNKTKMSRLYISKRRFSHPSLVTKRNALVLKVGVSYGWKMTKCVASYSQAKLR